MRSSTLALVSVFLNRKGTLADLCASRRSEIEDETISVWPQFDDGERRALQAVLESGVWWRTPGQEDFGV